jgi:pimeloyl-ACP methyl ester carboxylesterase
VSIAPDTVTLEANGRRFSALVQGDGPAVLLVHGFPDHDASFRHQLPALAAAGHRAVSPMLRGYEPSSQLRRKVPNQHPLQVAHDVAVWARTLGDGKPVHLVGHDWGAIIAYAVVALRPELFRSVTTIAVPPLDAVEAGIRRHPIQLRNSWYTLFFQLRGLSDAVVRANDFAFIEKLWRDWSPGWKWEPEAMEALKETFRQPGVLWHALAYYRAMLNPFLPDSRRMNEIVRRETDVPTLAITGATDGCMDTRIYDCVDTSRYRNGWRMERVEGAGHFCHQEKPDAVNALLLDWLAQHA